jgi:hypothetical protein
VTAAAGDAIPLRTAGTTPAPGPPRHILIHGKPIRLRWLQQIIWSFLVANAGALVISAIYYLLVQLNWHIGGHEILYLKPSWDKLFSFQGWDADRHNIRDVYEALLATLFVKSLLANWKKGGWHAPAWYVAISPLLLVVVAAPFVVLGVYLIDHAFPYLWHRWFGHQHVANPVHLPHTLAWAGTYLAGFPWQPVVIGILAGLVVHRVYAPAGRTVQLYFIGRAVDKARDAITSGTSQADARRHLPHWPMPPTVRERAEWIMDQGLPVPNRTTSITGAVAFVSGVLFCLTGYGAYIRYVVAKGH